MAIVGHMAQAVEAPSALDGMAVTRRPSVGKALFRFRVRLRAFLAQLRLKSTPEGLEIRICGSKTMSDQEISAAPALRRAAAPA
jgi:hypothetical protein